MSDDTPDIGVALVLARARNGTIGAENGLPWRLPRDLKRFKEITLGKPVVMGRKTHESIGRPLPDRVNIVITRDAAYNAEGCRVVHSLEAAISAARACAVSGGVDEICVIGGGEVYREALHLATRVYLTEVHADVPGDVSLPALPEDVWRETARNDLVARPGETADISFVVLERRHARPDRVDAAVSST